MSSNDPYSRKGDRPADSLLLRRALRRHRKEAGLSNAEAGKLFGLTASNICRAETGIRNPFSAYRLSMSFGVELARVLDPCPVCAYDPQPGFQCLHCGASEQDTHTCPSCDYTAGTVYEINDHTKTTHQINTKAGAHVEL